MWKFLSKIILNYRIPVLVFIGLVTILMGYNTSKIELSYEYARILPETDTNFINYAHFRENFGDDGNRIIVGAKPDNFYSLDFFSGWFDLCDSIQNLDGISNVLSTTHGYNLRKNHELKQFTTERITLTKPKTQVELDSVKRTIESLPVYRQILYNDSTQAHLIFITISPEKLNSKSRFALIEDIKTMLSNFEAKHQTETHISGLPYVRTAITKKLESEMYMFVILAFVVMIVILFLFFRSPKVVLVSMLVVAIGVIWTFGTIHLLGYKITILTGLIPPLIIVIGIPNSIFLINKYHNEYRKHGEKITALRTVISKIGSAILLTNLTTASGFATFIITSSTILEEFGIVASLNIMALFFLSISIVPIIFSYTKPPGEKQTKHLENKLMRKIVALLTHAVLHRRTLVYAITGALIVAGVFGTTLIKSTGYMCDDIPHHDPVFVDLKFFEQHFSGVMPLEILIDTKKKKGALQLSTLTKISKLQTKLSTYRELSKPLSIVDLVKFSRQAYYNGSENKYSLPSNMDIGFISKYISEQEDQTNFLHSILDSTKSIARITIQVADTGTTRMAELAKELTAEIDSIFPPDKYDTKLTGTSVVFFNGTQYLINSLFISLSLAIIIISVFMASMFKSVKIVLASIIPNLIPLLMTAALMGYFGVAVKPSTILIFSIAFGISVDDTIHYLAKFRQELASRSGNVRESVYYALKETGISMIYTSVVLFFGFGIFIASNFGGTVALGLLVSFTLVVAMITNLVLLPSILISFDAKRKKLIQKQLG